MRFWVWCAGVVLAGCANSSDGAETDAASGGGTDTAVAGSDTSGGAVCGGAGTACEQGQALLDVELKNCKGEKVRIADLVCNSKATLVYFGAGWCQPCRLKQPKLQKWYEEHAAEGLSIVTILREDGGPGDWATSGFCDEWTKEYGLTFPVLIDPTDKITSTCLGSGGLLPITVVTSPTWQVYYKNSGGDAPEAESTFTELLAQ